MIVCIGARNRCLEERGTMAERDGMPRVSIVVSNYNGMKILPSCLNSIENQTYPHFETIVVDDASTDASVKMLEGDFSWVRLVRNPRNLGAAESKNVGLEQAQNELVAFLDNDAVLDKHWLEEMIRFIGERENAGIVASKILFTDNHKIINSTGGKVNLAGYGWDRGIFEFDADFNPPRDRITYACSAAMIARKSILDQVGGFDSLFRYPYEDADLGWRMNLAGYEVSYNPAAVAYHKLSATMGRDNPRMIYLCERNRLRTMLKNFEAATWDNVRRDLALLYFQRMKIALVSKGMSYRDRWKTFFRLAEALAWNVANYGSTKEARKKVDALRKLSDLELIQIGAIENSIDLPTTVANCYLPDYQPRTVEDLNIASIDRLNMYDGCADYLGPGWHNREFTASYTAFRWTKEEAVCYLIPVKRPKNIVVKTVAANPLQGARGRVKVNDQVASEFYITDGQQTLEATIPPDSHRDIYEVKIIVDNAFYPAEEMHNADRRKLGVGISKIFLSS